MAKLTVDLSGRAGIANQINASSRSSYSGATGQVLPESSTFGAVYSPFLRPGYLSPANGTLASVSVDNALGAVPAASIYDPINDDLYFSDLGSQLFKGDTTTDTSLVRSVIISGAIIRDLAFYMVNGVRKMFVMYNTTGNKAEIAISNVPYDSSTDDLTYLSATVSGGFTNDSFGDVFLHVADNGFGYLLMENQVHKLDGSIATGGTNGTITPNALLFPVTFRMVDVVDYKGNTAIALHQYTNNTRTNNPSFILSGILDVGVYVWDRQETVASTVDYIPMNGVREINKLYVSSAGQLRVLVTTSLGFTEIRQYNGATFETIQVVGFDAYPVFRDSLTTLGTMTMWHGKDGVVYMHGKPYPVDDESLFKIFSQSVATANGGAILGANGGNVTAPAVYVGYQAVGNTPSIGRNTIYTSIGQVGGTNMVAATINYPVNFLPPMSVLKNITIYGARGTGSGATLAATMAVYLNENSTPWASKTISLDENARGYKRIEVNQPYVNSFQLQLTYPSAVTQGTTDFAPAYAIVEYDATTDKG